MVVASEAGIAGDGLAPPNRCWGGMATAGNEVVGALEPGAGILSEDVMTTLTGVVLMGAGATAGGCDTELTGIGCCGRDGCDGKPVGNM